MSVNDTVFFLSDYGLADEFVGVVHATLRRAAPQITVVDIGHLVPAFDVAAGARMLERAVPFLGSGVVLAVVDPGVGGPRRGVVIEAGDPDRPRYFVGPDNGLLLPAVLRCGGVVRAVVLESVVDRSAATFDGRDLFAPAVAALCNGAALEQMGPLCADAGLAQLSKPRAEVEAGTDGLVSWHTEVVWIDHFGNVALAGTGDATAPTWPPEGSITLEWPGATSPLTARRVEYFAQLASGEIGLLVDANGSWALVVDGASCASVLGLSVGDMVRLVG